MAIKIFTGGTTKCPKCGEDKLWHNKGTSMAGNPYENVKCQSCGYFKWLTDNYYTAKEKAEQPEDEKKFDYAMDEMIEKRNEQYCEKIADQEQRWGEPKVNY